jgi:hypothetical protein
MYDLPLVIVLLTDNTQYWYSTGYRSMSGIWLSNEMAVISHSGFTLAMSQALM